jgi:hypothetical protein
MNTHTDQTAVGPRLDEPERSPVRITSPGELVASIPAIFGFHPAQSLVGLLLTARSALACSVRIDLADGLPEAAEVLAHACRSADADRAVLLVYTDSGTGPMPHTDDLAELIDQLEQQGIAVPHALLVVHDVPQRDDRCGWTALLALRITDRHRRLAVTRLADPGREPRVGATPGLRRRDAGLWQP